MANPALRVILTTALLLSVLAVAGKPLARTIIDPKTALADGKEHQPQQSSALPAVLYTAHNRGKVQLAVGNNGTFGVRGGSITDPFSGEVIQSCVYPRNTDLVYLWVSAIWIGGIVGRDTLVSVGDEDFYQTTELWPDVEPFGRFRYESIDPGNEFFSEDAYSEQDIICEYTDTLTDPSLVEPDNFSGRSHQPLGVKVTQRSMAWSYAYADDFVLFDYQVENIGPRKLREVYLGVWVDGDVWHTTRNNPEGWRDDLVGFYHTHPSQCAHCPYDDTIAVAYHTDNDGDPAEDGGWDDRSVPHVMGVRVVRTPQDSLSYSFNWWVTDYATYDFGPRRRGTANDPFRDFGTGLGLPRGDRNKYYIMRHQEFDYDLIRTAKNKVLQGWLPPPENAKSLARGHDCRYLLSFGPFEVSPGQKLPVSFAWVGGTNLHSGSGNWKTLFDPMNPDPWYNSLDFSNLARNARWASWVYDNPNVDTDGDGYYGEFITCPLDSLVYSVDTVIDGIDTVLDVTQYTAVETCWIEGDGVPDFKGAGPPPAPDIRVRPDYGRLRVLFNGALTETTKDVFSRLVDFEGYRVYLARDERPQSFRLLTSYDRKNFNKWILDNNDNWILLDPPFTYDELVRLYDDTTDNIPFDPLRFTRTQTFSPPDHPDSVFYFEAQDYNVSELGVDTDIRKVYPDQPYPSSLDPDSAAPSELTEDGFLKYFEYEIVIEDLLPSVPYYVNVTAFDFGSPVAGLPSLETSVLNGYVKAYPMTPGTETADKHLKVHVYPNPYRVDATYGPRGFERRGGDTPVEKARLLHFGNVPPRCTIRIYSLDGDLVKRIDHNEPVASATSSHATWDLITRNRQLAVTGLYYYVVESSHGTDIGKFVIIR